MQPGGALDGQRMHGQALGRKGPDLLQRAQKVVRRLARQGRDDVHVDVVKAQTARQGERLADIPRRVRAPDGAKRRVVHRLRIDADAAHARIPQRAQLVRIQRVGPSGLDRQLPRARERARHPRKQARQLRGRERRRRAAADIDRPQVKPRLVHQRARRVDLVKERAQVRLDQVPVADLARGKRAVRAARRAKRDAHVHVHILRGALHDPALADDDLAQQRGLLLRQVERVPQCALGLLQRIARLHLRVEQPRGTDARERAPRRPAARQPLHQVIAAQLDRALEQPLFRKPAVHGLRPPLAGDGLAAGQLAALQPEPVRLRVRVPQRRVAGLAVRDGRSLPEKQPHHVAQVGEELRRLRLNADLHRYVLRSAAIVVSAPWPGRTHRLPSSAASLRSDASSCAPSPPGKSVRP